MQTLLQLFWLFIKINLLSTSGPASIGLLHAEAVGSLLTEAQFIEVVGLSNLLPGSEALKLAMFVGYGMAGTPGALVSLLGSILPPTVLMFAVVAVLNRLRREAWVSNFVKGLTPSVAILMFFVAIKIMEGSGDIDWRTALIGVASLIAMILDAPAPLVLLFAGLAGVVLF
ncbi:MAG: chromate transporter [Chloroflexi bacterium]|nr:chromate transporter [Chloroflexota bacterium]